MFEGTWYQVHYKCLKCGEMDSEKRLLNDSSPVSPIINCWNCGAGRGLDIPQMIQQRMGMVPVEPPSADGKKARQLQAVR